MPLAPMNHWPQVPIAGSAGRKGWARSKDHIALGIPLAVAALGSGPATGGPVARRWLRLPDRGVAVRRQGSARGVRREGHAGACRLAQDFFAAFSRLTLLACLPSAVRVSFCRWAIVR